MRISDDSTISQIYSRLSGHFQIEKVILFGSRATGRQHRESDYDLIFIVRNSDLPRIKRSQKAREILWGLEASVDLFIFTQEEFDALKDSPNTIPQIAISEGIELDAA